MASVEQLERALVNADRAGDVDAAKKLATALKAARAQSEPVERGSFLPIAKDAEGNISFDSDAGVLGSLKRTVMGPYDAFTGKLPPGAPETYARAAEAGTWMTPSGVAGRAAKLVPPSAETLKATAGGQFEAMRNLGVDYSSQAVANMANGLRASLERDGILKELAPKTFGILERLQKPPAGSVASITGLDAARKSLRLAAKDFANPTEQLASGRLIGELDRFINRPGADAVVSGPAAQAARLNRNARGNYAAAKRSEQLTGIEDQALLRSAAANSGRNLDNAIRSRAATLLSNPKNRAGFSKDELALIEEVARGTASRNAIRYVGNLLGGGGGLGAALTGTIGGAVGGAMGGPLGVAAGVGLPAVGAMAKTFGNRATRKALERADTAVRSRSPLFDTMIGLPRPAPLPAPMTQSVASRAMMADLLAAPQLPSPKSPPITAEQWRAYLAAGGA